MTSWLVTGGCGFIGRNLIRSLQRAGGHTIFVYDNRSVAGPESLEQRPVRIASANDYNNADGCYFIEGDIRDTSELLKIVAQVDVVVHLAANTGVAPSVNEPMLDCAANVIGTLNMLEFARTCGAKRFVFASSGAPLGEVDPPLSETTLPRPVSPYGASKLSGEAYCSAYWRTFGLGTVALRFSNVYGPGSRHKSSAVAAFITNALAARDVVIYGDGLQTRDFLYVGDLVEAITQAAVVPDIEGEIFQIATNTGTTVLQLVDLLAELIEVKTGYKVSSRHEPARLGDVRFNFSDISKARKTLGWEPKVKIKEGLEETLSYFLELR